MRDSWLTKYPRAAAMLQGDEDVLDYAPQSFRGLDEEPPLPAAAPPPQADGEELDRGDW